MQGEFVNMLSYPPLHPYKQLCHGFIDITEPLFLVLPLLSFTVSPSTHTARLSSELLFCDVVAMFTGGSLKGVINMGKLGPLT